jgi:hypothetical protein
MVKTSLLVAGVAVGQMRCNHNDATVDIGGLATTGAQQRVIVTTCRLSALVITTSDTAFDLAQQCERPGNDTDVYLFARQPRRYGAQFVIGGQRLFLHSRGLVVYDWDTLRDNLLNCG